MLSSGLNANDIKTALDDVFYPEYNVDSNHPEYASAVTPSVFHQDTADSSAVIWELFQGVGQWETRAESQDVPEASPRIGNQKTFTVTAFAKQVKIPKHFFDDDKHKRLCAFVEKSTSNNWIKRKNSVQGQFRTKLSLKWRLMVERLGSETLLENIICPRNSGILLGMVI